MVIKAKDHSINGFVIWPPIAHIFGFPIFPHIGLVFAINFASKDIDTKRKKEIRKSTLFFSNFYLYCVLQLFFSPLFI